MAHGADRKWIKGTSWKPLPSASFHRRRTEACNSLLQHKPHRESSTAEAIDYNRLPGSDVWVSKAWCEKSANACLAWRSPENKSKQDMYILFLLFETWKTSSSSNSISASDPSRAALWSCLCGKDEKTFPCNYKPLISTSGGINAMWGGIWGISVPFPRVTVVPPCPLAGME